MEFSNGKIFFSKKSLPLRSGKKSSYPPRSIVFNGFKIKFLKLISFSVCIDSVKLNKTLLFSDSSRRYFPIGSFLFSTEN